MKVFIGWSGDQSKAVAQLLSDWLPLVLRDVEPWMSETGIAAGERWAKALDEELNRTNFGILCITQENLDSTWVSFEAGALAREYEKSRVIPLLLNLEQTEIMGPLTQFQAKKADKAGVCDVIKSINSSLEKQEPEKRVLERFESLWRRFDIGIKEIPEQSSVKRPKRPQQEVLEELVAGVRSVEARLNEVIEKLPAAIAFQLERSVDRLYFREGRRPISTTYLHRKEQGSGSRSEELPPSVSDADNLRAIASYLGERTTDNPFYQGLHQLSIRALKLADLTTEDRIKESDKIRAELDFFTRNPPLVGELEQAHLQLLTKILTSYISTNISIRESHESNDEVERKIKFNAGYGHL